MIDSIRFILICIAATLLCSCHSTTNTERKILKYINKSIVIDVFDSVYYEGGEMLFSTFRKQHPYISIVELKDGCYPCYAKFIEWQNKMDSIKTENAHTILFLINDLSYDSFIRKVNRIDPTFRDRYFSIIDSSYKYVDLNPDIPESIRKRSILINNRNEIVMIGAPFANSKMTDLYRHVCSRKSDQ